LGGAHSKVIAAVDGDAKLAEDEKRKEEMNARR